MLQLKDNPSPAYSASRDEEALGNDEWAQTWTVAYCKPRQEKALAHDLRQRGVSYFLPMVLRETSSGGRRRRNLYPLFTSYLFFAGGAEERLVAAKTNRISGLIEVKQSQQDEFRRELAAIEKALQAAPDKVQLHPHLTTGTPVKVASGPLKGVEGAVIRWENRRKLLLSVTALGTGVAVEIDPDLVDAYS